MPRAKMGSESGRAPRSLEPGRDIEAMVLVTLIEAHPEGLTESAVQHELTSVVNSPGRVAAISRAVEALVEVGLVVREAELLLPTQSAIRAAELEVGF
jgi:hypothetical protein